MPLLFFFLVWPLAEIALMIKVGQETGAFNTLLLIIATAVFGLLLVQLEWRRLADNLANKPKQSPQDVLGPLLETAAVGLAGILLFIPGFISDFLGVFLLLPITRKFLIAPLKKRQSSTIFEYRNAFYGEKPETPDAKPGEPEREGKVLEGEYQRKDDHRP